VRGAGARLGGPPLEPRCTAAFPARLHLHRVPMITFPSSFGRPPIAGAHADSAGFRLKLPASGGNEGGALVSAPARIMHGHMRITWIHGHTHAPPLPRPCRSQAACACWTGT
jgi:hypothetical protein